MLERLAVFQYQGRRQLDGLRVSCLRKFLVRQFHPYLVDVETDVRFVLDGKVDEEIVAHRVNIVQAHYHSVRLGRHVADFRGRVPYPSCKTHHVGCRHRDRRIVVGIPFL